MSYSDILVPTSMSSPVYDLPSRSTRSNNDVLVRVEGVKKKFCRSLKKSLWYGVKDMAAELVGSKGRHDILREGEFWAVNDVSFELKRGECIGLIGHNGAGKTTLLKMLNGLIKPDQGWIEMRGRVSALIALGAGFNPILTGRENIYVNGSVLGLSKSELDATFDEIVDFAEIREFIDAPVQSYSSGMAVRLGFAIAVKCKPDVLLLDEVLAVGDVGFQAKCFNTLSEFRKNGTAFILVSHNMHQISRYCDYLLYMKKGKVEHTGDVEIGISKFTRDMDPENSGAVNETTDWGKIYGTGRVVFKNAQFLSQTGTIINQINPGETFTLEIDYECPNEDVSDSMLDLVIRDKDGVLYQGTSLAYGAEFGRLKRNGKLSITFERLPINSPELKFSFALISTETNEMYDWKREIRLKIARKPKLTGRLALQVKWTADTIAVNDRNQ